MKLNESQEAKRAVASLTSQISDAQEAMLLAGEWPSNRPIPVQKYDGEFYSATLHYDREANVWVLRRISKVPGSDTPLIEERNSSRTELLSRFLSAWLNTTLENAEIERQNAELMNMDPEEKETDEFLNDYQEGEQFREMKRYLPGDDSQRERGRERMFELLKAQLAKLGLPWTANNLAVAHVELLDNNDEYWAFKLAADSEKQREVAEAQAEADEAAIDASRQSIVEAAGPSVNSTRKGNRPFDGVEGRNIYAYEPSPRNIKAMRQRIVRTGGFGKNKPQQ